MNKENIITFIALWEQDFGTKVVDLYPMEEEFDFNSIANNIFITYHNFYKKDTEFPSEKILFKLPLVSINKKAEICLLGPQNEREDSTLQLFIVVILLPDYFPEERMEVFDNILQNIGMEYIETEVQILEKKFNQINELFILEQTVKDSEISIDENYLITNALQDFKTGLEQYKKKELDRSYFLLRKAYSKFELDSQLNLLLETTYFIGTILIDKNKFKVARDYFQKLETLAQQLQHEKYYERAIFMEGYCDYQENDYKNAHKNFMKLTNTNLQFVSKLQYSTLMGKVLADIGHFDDAIISLEEALEYSQEAEDSIKIKEKRAEIYLDLGQISYEMVYQATKSGKVDDKLSKSNLFNSIKYFEEVIKIWKTLDYFPGLIDVYQLMASIYEILEELGNALKCYEKALEFAEISNDLVNKFKIIEKMIQIYIELNLHEDLIKKIDVILHDIAPVAYLDRFTVAGFHRYLGESFIAIGREDDALPELIVAQNLYTEFSKPVPELLIVYKSIIDIYKQKEDSSHIEYYKDRRKRLKIELYEALKREKIESKPLDIVSEFWIFTIESDTIFSYTPKSNTDPQLLSGFLIALANFGPELKVDQLKTIKFGSEYFAYYKEKNHSIFIIGRSNIKFQRELVEEIIQKIYLKFWAIYEPFLKDFDGDSSKFDPFLSILKKSDLFN